MRFTVKDVLSMLEHGILPEDATTELLHGFIVLKDQSETGGDPTMHGLQHRKCVVRLGKLAARIDSAEQHVQIQLPVICGDFEAPEPDFAIARGTEDDYDKSLPTGRDVSCVIEAADSSVERDSEEKPQIYASGGVKQYIVLNLRDRTAQIFSDPDVPTALFRSTITVPDTTTLRLLLPDGKTFEVVVSDLLP